MITLPRYNLLIRYALLIIMLFCSFYTYAQKDYVFDTNFFTQNLETFTSLAFLSDGINILKPSKLQMFPYFKKEDI